MALRKYRITVDADDFRASVTELVTSDLAMENFVSTIKQFAKENEVKDIQKILAEIRAQLDCGTILAHVNKIRVIKDVRNYLSNLTGVTVPLMDCKILAESLLEKAQTEYENEMIKRDRDYSDRRSEIPRYYCETCNEYHPGAFENRDHN